MLKAKCKVTKIAPNYFLSLEMLDQAAKATASDSTQFADLVGCITPSKDVWASMGKSADERTKVVGTTSTMHMSHREIAAAILAMYLIKKPSTLSKDKRVVLSTFYAENPDGTGTPVVDVSMRVVQMVLDTLGCDKSKGYDPNSASHLDSIKKFVKQAGMTLAAERVRLHSPPSAMGSAVEKFTCAPLVKAAPLAARKQHAAAWQL